MNSKNKIIVVAMLIVCMSILMVNSVAALNCWDKDGTTMDECTDYDVNVNGEADDCWWDSWGSYCMEKGCWDQSSQESCNAENDTGCIWKSESDMGWNTGWCTDLADCWNQWDYDGCTGVSGCAWKNASCQGPPGCDDVLSETSCYGSSLGCWWDYGSYCYSPGCWDYGGSSDCGNATGCNWVSDAYCTELGGGSYFFNNQTSCEIAGFIWESWGSGDDGYCYQPNCYDYSDTLTCNNASSGDCAWSVYDYCYEKSCWNYWNQTACTDNGDSVVGGCDWTNSGYCSEPSCPSFDGNATGCNASVGCIWDADNSQCQYEGCWNYYDTGSCANVTGCQWKETSCMGSSGCENLETYDACYDSSLSCWWDYGDYCEETDCWDFDDNQSYCETDSLTYNLDCTWDSYWGECWENWCGEYSTENSCNDSVSGDCYWDANANYCYEENCWGYSDETNCENRGCAWDGDYGYCEQASAASCYDLTQSECTNGTYSTSCKWDYGWGGTDGWCSDRGCWDLYDSTSCSNASLDVSCEWVTDSGGWCEEEGTNCWDYYTEENCGANNCTWDAAYNSCYEKGCWDHWTNSSCAADSSCQWSTGSADWGWCEKVSCWSWDNTNESGCENNSYSLSCEWDNSSSGWCMGPWQNNCWELDAWQGGNASACNALNTTGENCTWQAMSGWCYESSKTFSDFTSEGECLSSGWGSWNGSDCVVSEQTDFQNPGCWIFDGKPTECNGIQGCTYNTTSTECSGLDILGIQCENISSVIANNVTNTTLCEVLPMLSTCCKYQGGQCATSYDTACWDQMADPPEGATFCSDFNVIDSRPLCDQISGEPWYMPCTWNNVSTECGFKGDLTDDLDNIKTKKECAFVGGTWKTESVCDDASNCPYAETWCEIETGSSLYGCDMSCWACNTSTSCRSSTKGYCMWVQDTSLTQGGYCDIPETIETFGDCDTSCPSCEYYSGGTFTPEEACLASKNQCKWDNSTESCIEKKSKGCGDDCFYCYNLDDCNMNGGGAQGTCKWDNSDGMCTPANFDSEICFDGSDNDNDELVDCEDPECTFDPFCGGGEMGECWLYQDSTSCGIQSDCEWIQDPWTSDYRCGMKGESCWMYQTNVTGCGSDVNCKWYENTFCEINHSLSETCFQKTTESGCEAVSSCKWQADPYSPQDGWCDFAMFECHWNSTLGGSRTNCESNSLCSWVTDPWSGSGWCDPKCFAKDSDGDELYTTQSSCEGAVTGGLCEWSSGWCEPNVTSTGSVDGRDCPSYDGNMTSCEEQPGCAWFEQHMSGSDHVDSEEGGFFGSQCDVKHELAVDCWMLRNQTECNFTNRTNGYNNTGDQDACRWITEGSWSWCEQIGWHCGPTYSPFNMTTYQPETDTAACAADPYCMVDTDEYMGNQEVCVSNCFNVSLGQSDCESVNTQLGSQMCVWYGFGGGGGESTGGWCDPKGSEAIFESMESGVPYMLGSDVCGAGSDDAALNDWIDLCGAGIKETNDDYMMGMGLSSMTYAGVCNGESLWDGSTGSGRKATKGYWYLDTDGTTDNNCYSDDGAENGFEFKLVAEWTWSDEGLKEMLSAKRCSNSSWVAANIRLDTHAKKMCQEMQGMIVTVKKADLNNFPSLFDISHPMRIYSVSAGENNTATAPADSVGPNYYKSGTVDFKLEHCDSIGKVDKDGDGFYSYEDPDCKHMYMDEEFGMKGTEDCTNLIDDDRDGAIDCTDIQCKDEVVCGSAFAVNATDKEAPEVIEIDADENSNTAQIVVKTEERANVTLKFYNNDSTGSRINSTIRAEGMQKGNFTDERERFVFNSVISLNNFTTNTDMLNYTLDNATTYYYRVEVCDVSGNCGESGLRNFTTKAVTERSTIKVTDSDSGQTWQIDNGSGTYANPGSACSSSSTSTLGEPIDPDQISEVDLRMQLTNADSLAMEVRLEGVETGSDVIAPLDLDIGTLTGSESDVTEDYFAIDESDWGGNDGIYSVGHPDTLVLSYPGDDTELWDCAALSGSTPINCTNITGYAIRSYSSGTDITEWTISNPPIHIWSYIIDQTPVAAAAEESSSSSGGGGSGGAGSTTSDEEEEEESTDPVSEVIDGVVEDVGDVAGEAGQRVAEFAEDVGESFTDFGWLWFALASVIAVGVVLFIVFRKKA